MLTFKPTQRNFMRAEFTDLYGSECSIQESSLATQPAIWLGVDTKGNAESTRMHLSIDQARELIVALSEFVNTGALGRNDAAFLKALEEAANGNFVSLGDGAAFADTLRRKVDRIEATYDAQPCGVEEKFF